MYEIVPTFEKNIGGGSYYNNENVSLLYIIWNFCKIAHYRVTSENQIRNTVTRLYI